VTPRRAQGAAAPYARALTRAPPLARALTHWCVDPGGESGGIVFSGCSEPWFSGILASPLSGCSDLWALLLGCLELWVYGILTSWVFECPDSWVYCTPGFGFFSTLGSPALCVDVYCG